MLYSFNCGKQKITCLSLFNKSLIYYTIFSYCMSIFTVYIVIVKISKRVNVCVIFIVENNHCCNSGCSRLSKNSSYRKRTKNTLIKLKNQTIFKPRGCHRETRAVTCFLRKCSLPYHRTPTRTFYRNIPSFFNRLSACRLYRHAERTIF